MKIESWKQLILWAILIGVILGVFGSLSFATLQFLSVLRDIHSFWFIDILITLIFLTFIKEISLKKKILKMFVFFAMSSIVHFSSVVIGIYFVLCPLLGGNCAM